MDSGGSLGAACGERTDFAGFTHTVKTPRGGAQQRRADRVVAPRGTDTVEGDGEEEFVDALDAAAGARHVDAGDRRTPR
jgi:hypothetical protein